MGDETSSTTASGTGGKVQGNPPDMKENVKLPSSSLKYHNAPVEIANLPLSYTDDHQSQQQSSLDVQGAADVDETPCFDANLGYKTSHPTRTLYYPTLEKCLSLESDLQVIYIYMYIRE